jgi:ribonuclease D
VTAESHRTADGNGADPNAADPNAADPNGADPNGADEPGPELPEVQAVPLLEPRDGMPPLIVTAAALEEAVRALAAGSGPVAVDAERASGFRYGHRAFLVQLRRRGAGTVLIDPVACPDLSGLDAALAGTEAVLHAASQDLPCLADLGYRPRSLFDTELAGRLLGYPRVGLGPLVETVLGLSLEKGHAAADWSTRPLPEDWLRYAALDVEVLVELRDALAAQLAAQGKDEWARQEFAAVLSAGPPPPRPDPWRRTSGIHRVRTRRGLAIVRELWLERDRIAQRRDLSPGRVLPDSAIVEAARAAPTSLPALLSVPGFRGRGAKRHGPEWFGAIRRAHAEADQALPRPASQVADGPPPAHRWPERDPEAARRLAAIRAVIAALADEHSLPTENLVQPDAVRRLAWQPPDPVTAEAVSAHLAGYGARPWQVGLVAVPVTGALHRLAEKDGE